MLPVKDSKKISLYDCLDNYFDNETVQDFRDDNNVNYSEVTKKIKIWEFPNILIVCLNRFDNNNTKINTKVDYELTINLSKYGLVRKKQNYELYSMYLIITV